MFPKSILVSILVLALVSMACGVTVNVPKEEVITGPTQTMAINVPVQDNDPVNLALNFGAGELSLNPGAQNALVDGTATYNVDDFKPVVTVAAGNVQISTGDLEVQGFPRVQVKDFKNTWALLLGSQPMNLEINAGAYQGDYELGGLSLANLEVNDGAADVKLAFSQPNLIAMEKLVYTTGASQVALNSLANANFTELIFRSGAGSYTLDFGGQLQRDANVLVESGLSQLTIIIPPGVNAIVSFEGGLSHVDVQGDWKQTGDNYRMTGSGPTLTIRVSMGAGSLELKN